MSVAVLDLKKRLERRQQARIDSGWRKYNVKWPDGWESFSGRSSLMNRNGHVNENARWPRVPRNSKGREWTSGLENNRSTLLYLGDNI